MLKKILNAIKYFIEPVAKTISSIVNFILLALVYFIGIGVVSISMKIFKRHFLELKKTNRKSNWQEHRVTKQPLEKYYRTF
ncbi:hypothetical protein HYY71_00465 [Candidatus Woesearchaeota archaeon]|nr:hypothetical protein [Candidatus Woesearchaeota archaeon]